MLVPIKLTFLVWLIQLQLKKNIRWQDIPNFFNTWLKTQKLQIYP